MELNVSVALPKLIVGMVLQGVLQFEILLANAGVRLSLFSTARSRPLINF